MKKLFIGLFMLLVTSVAFAETTFWGFSFDKTEKEFKTTSKDNEQRIQKIFDKYFSNICGDIDEIYQFDKDDKTLTSITFTFDEDVKVGFVQSFFDTYFSETLKCKFSNGTYYNDDIIAHLFINPQGKGEEACYLVVSKKIAYNKLIDEL